VILLAKELLKIDIKQSRKLKTIFSAEVDLFMCPRLLKHTRKLKKARKAVAISRGAIFTPQKVHSDYASSLSLDLHATPVYFKARKMAIYYQFLLYGAPEEEQWANVNLINTIMINLCIPRGNYQRVRKVLLDCLQSIHFNMEYNPLCTS
jgi:hypothetical protein